MRFHGRRLSASTDRILIYYLYVDYTIVMSNNEAHYDSHLNKLNELHPSYCCKRKRQIRNRCWMPSLIKGIPILSHMSIELY